MVQSSSNTWFRNTMCVCLCADAKQRLLPVCHLLVCCSCPGQALAYVPWLLMVLLVVDVYCRRLVVRWGLWVTP
jgi:hypothetical protein